MRVRILGICLKAASNVLANKDDFAANLRPFSEKMAGVTYLS